MADVHTPEQRSRNMAAIKSRDTVPELIVRRIVHSMGFRYGLHSRGLPGKPDLVLRKYKKVIFVHGCFWHIHNCTKGLVKPKANAGFWENKRLGNVARDKRNRSALTKAGWKVLIVWECESRSERKLRTKILRFLDAKKIPIIRRSGTPNGV